MLKDKLRVYFLKLTCHRTITIVTILAECLFASPENVETVMDDKEFFGLLDLEYPALEEANAALKKEDYKKAKIEFVNYLKSRKKPVYFPLEMCADFPVIKVDKDVVKTADDGLLPKNCTVVN